MAPVFFSAPHRVMFAGGAIQLLLGMALWALELQGRYLGLLPVPAWPFPPAWIHAGIMVFGIFPWFIFGFLMTALPKWMAARPLAGRDYLPAFGLLAGGWLAFYAGLLVPSLAPAGIVAVALGWGWGANSLRRAMADSLNDRRHARVVLGGLAAGIAGLLAYAYALTRLDAAAFRWGIEIGLWGCLAPVFFTVLHRMLPFFTSAVVRGYRPYQPWWALWTMVAALAGHGLLAALELPAWRWLPDVVAAGVAVRQSSRWGLRASLVMPMVAMLHLGALWLSVGMGLFALQGMAAALGASWGGLAPLHAIGAGFFASILIAMGTRVTLGHSGRPIAADRRAWKVFLAVQGVVALRLAGELAAPVNLVAALGWLAAFGFWAARYLPMYFIPRPDGEAG